MALSVGVKVTEALELPTDPGTVAEFVNAKVPGTDADPPERVDDERA